MPSSYSILCSLAGAVLALSGFAHAEAVKTARPTTLKIVIPERETRPSSTRAEAPKLPAARSTRTGDSTKKNTEKPVENFYAEVPSASKPVTKAIPQADPPKALSAAQPARTLTVNTPAAEAVTRPTLRLRASNAARELVGGPTVTSFNSDYKTRSVSADTPLLLRGCGLNGRNIPVGEEDAYRGCLTTEYLPTDLYQLPREMCYGNMVLYLRKEAALSLIKMTNAAAREGLTLQTFSAFRDVSHQRRLYNEMISRGGRGTVAKPGYSEHMFGTTADLTNDSKYMMKRSFENTPEGRWLSRNAARYGWKATVMSGAGSRSHVDEPWHLRYYGPGRIPAGRGSSSSVTVASKSSPVESAASLAVAPVKATGRLLGNIKGALTGKP
ncbi:hypothetical protein CVU37_12155 [candidate division BRC1 bacterium HGW-BRC1-1]|jgi:hypothetical protein|nr:MAG: hypothetical protein CVU37_12155 [candidate division BRC1 bacterium HGW-BRC1-1]